MFGLSIIIINYNTFQLTCECIQSIYKTDLSQIDIEIILIDNKSTEQESIDFQRTLKQIKYYKNESNIGFAKANNVGISLSTKDYILLLNSDTLLTNAKTLIGCIQFVKKEKNKIILTPKLLTQEGKAQVCYGYFPSLRNELFFTFFIHKLLPSRIKQNWLWEFVPDENRFIENGYITATFFLFHRNLIELLDGKKLYDNIFLYGEELFWAQQALNKKYRLYYFADQSIVHLIGASLKSENKKINRKKYQALGEHLYLIWRHHKVKVIMIYCLRFFRYILLSVYSRDIRVRLRSLIEVLFINKQI